MKNLLTISVLIASTAAFAQPQERAFDNVEIGVGYSNTKLENGTTIEFYDFTLANSFELSDSLTLIGGAKFSVGEGSITQNKDPHIYYDSYEPSFKEISLFSRLEYDIGLFNVGVYGGFGNSSQEINQGAYTCTAWDADGQCEDNAWDMENETTEQSLSRVEYGASVGKSFGNRDININLDYGAVKYENADAQPKFGLSISFGF